MRTAICNNLNNLRKGNGMTQSDVASHLQISHQRYNYYENGRNEPGIAMLRKIASFYNITVDELISEGEEKEMQHVAMPGAPTVRIRYRRHKMNSNSSVGNAKDKLSQHLERLSKHADDGARTTDELVEITKAILSVAREIAVLDESVR